MIDDLRCLDVNSAVGNQLKKQVILKTTVVGTTSPMKHICTSQYTEQKTVGLNLYDIMVVTIRPGFAGTVPVFVSCRVITCG
jgi:hypothetical protein